MNIFLKPEVKGNSKKKERPILKYFLGVLGISVVVVISYFGINYIVNKKVPDPNEKSESDKESDHGKESFKENGKEHGKDLDKLEKKEDNIDPILDCIKIEDINYDDKGKSIFIIPQEKVLEKIAEKDKKYISKQKDHPMRIIFYEMHILYVLDQLMACDNIIKEQKKDYCIFIIDLFKNIKDNIDKNLSEEKYKNEDENLVKTWTDSIKKIWVAYIRDLLNEN